MAILTVCEQIFGKIRCAEKKKWERGPIFIEKMHERTNKVPCLFVMLLTQGNVLPMGRRAGSIGKNNLKTGGKI